LICEFSYREISSHLWLKFREKRIAVSLLLLLQAPVLMLADFLNMGEGGVGELKEG